MNKNADIDAFSADLVAQVSRVNADAYGESIAGGFTGTSNAYGDVTLTSTAKVDLLGDATSDTRVTGWNGVDIQAIHLNNDEENSINDDDEINTSRYVLDGHKKSRFYGLSIPGGSSGEHTTLTNQVKAQQGLTITAGPRILTGAGVTNELYQSTNLDQLDHLTLFTEVSSPNADTLVRSIFWEATVILLGEPNPVLVIDNAGKIVQKTWNVDVRAYNPSGTFSDLLDVGDTIGTGQWIVVDDLIYDESGFVKFSTNDLSNDDTDSVIFGNAGEFWVQDTWDSVTITNSSDRQLVTNLIDVTSSADDPEIQVWIDKIPGPTDSPLNDVSLLETNPATFEFDILHLFKKTKVDVRNLQPDGIAASDIVLDGAIENPIGHTYIQNERGSILADDGNYLGIEDFTVTGNDTDHELIRTNKLELDADTGSIGQQDGPRVPIEAEIIQFRDEANTLYDIRVQAEALTDVVLDLTANRRSGETLGSDFDVTIDSLLAGDDVDVVIHDSIEGTELGDVGDVKVKLYKPSATSAYHNQGYKGHFRPDVVPTGLDRILRAFGTDEKLLDSDYIFGDGVPTTLGDLRAGDDINIRHTETGTTVTFTAFTDVDATLNDIDTGTSMATADDDGQIDFLTNGFIWVEEQNRDLRVGHIHSTADDVTLYSPWAILDADGQATIDVTGENITMYAALINGTSGPNGGIGKPTDFLEINVDASNSATLGVLKAYDSKASSSDGIYLSELIGHMEVDTVDTKFDASLRTVGGSIRDARNAGLGDTAANVLGQTIDLDANGIGSSIGAFNNDLEIDSSVDSPTGDLDDVGLEASDSIFLTETDADLRLVLAHTYTGDIRLTVRESTALDEDLNLLASGAARFAEDESTIPGSQDDDPRSVPHGQIFAEQGWVLLQVGDDVTLDDNSEIVAAENIGIFGDYGNADVDDDLFGAGDGHGTYMTLRGKLVAGAQVTLGSQDGDPPVGSYLPSALSPVYQTNIWGHIDVDTFQFGDMTGYAGTNIWGEDGYIFLGSKTRVHGSQDPDSRGDDGEDRFIIYYLQDTLTLTSPATENVVAEHTLTLDGQADTDYYEVHTLGSNGEDNRNYVINVLDTGDSNDGVDELTIFGNDDTSGETTTDDIFLLRAATELPNETADRPAYVAMVHGTLDEYLDTIEDNEDSPEVQRINYDTGLNGRLTVLGLGGNDTFFSDDSTVNVTLDGGAGSDSFQIGQIFGTKRTDLPDEGNLLEQDVFPNLVATTRGWLSPGISAPMVVHGGTGNDEFTVYSNQAELRLEGDDDNDLFVVRAFALAQVDDGETPDNWTDDELILENDIPKPIIGASGFSTDRPVDIRAGGGEDEVQYNVNAPVSLDGGTGFDKLVILGTEFADDFVITQDGIYGAGLNVSYENIEVVEVDGLEGDDEFFVQSTAFGVAYRVIGGLGSDTINVTGDVVEDIVTREIEGVSGAVDHLVTSDDPLYNGLIVDGFDYNVATADEGIVVITESDGFTAVREGGPTPVDSYTVRLAKELAVGEVVYVTVSAARSPQEEADDLLVNPDSLPNGEGDSIWLSTSSPADITDPLDTEFQRKITVNGVTTYIDNRAVVLTFDHTNWYDAQEIFVFAPDDTRSEGDRIVVVQHSVISNVDEYDAADVRNVEVQVRDNDTPGVYVTEVEPGTNIEDGRTLVIEGDVIAQNLITDNADPKDYTGLNDEVLVQLAMAPEVSDVIVVKMTLNAEDNAQIKLIDVDNLPASRFDEAAGTITFDHMNWDLPVRVGIEAWNDYKSEDPGTAVISFELDPSTTDIDGNYIFPNLRSGLGLQDVEVIDNETAGAVVLESGSNTLFINDGIDTDDYTIRLTKQPRADVQVAILTDGLADVVSIDGTPITTADYKEIGGLRATQLFNGSITFEDTGGKGTLTRGTGADLGSFMDEGFEAGDLLRIGGAGAPYDGDYVIESVNNQTITLTTAFGVGGSVEVQDTIILSDLTREGDYTGLVTVEENSGNGANRIVREDYGSWLADGFLEGQWVKITSITDPNNTVDAKIAVIRGLNDTFDEKVEFTLETPDLPDWLKPATTPVEVQVTRIAAVATFDASDWYVQQNIELAADTHYEVPTTREGVKVFPVSTHLLSKLRGPLAVEGGVTGADRSLKNGLKLPGEADDFLFAIGAQAPESQQIDVLNIYNDASQENGAGVMTETTLSGFGMAETLDFGELYGLGSEDADTFGESLVFPGGISYGKINFGSGGFGTSNNTSTIEVVNLMLGEGNDSLDIQGTLNPAPAVSATNDFIFTPDGTNGGGIVELRGFDWKAQGFLVGQTVKIKEQTGSWTVSAIDDFVTAEGADPNDNSILVLSGPSLPPLSGEQTIIGIDKEVNVSLEVDVASINTDAFTGGTVTRNEGDWSDDGFTVGHLVTVEGDGASGQWRITDINGLTMILEGDVLSAGDDAEMNFSVAGEHGGLTVVHGGGNMLLEITGTMEVTEGGEYVEIPDVGEQTSITYDMALTRLDGLAWSGNRYEVGQRIQISDEEGTREILAIVDASDIGVLPVGDVFDTWGTGNALLLGSRGSRAGGVPVSPGTAELTIHVAEALRTNVAEDISIQTSSLTRTGGTSWADDGFFMGQQIYIEGLAGPFTIESLDGPVMTLQDVALTPQASAELTVYGYDSTLDGGVRVGGDHITITGGAGPDSPLVVYGDTSQDGVWYSGHPYDVLGYEFGDKPFNPFPEIPDAENEDDEWVFPLANPYTYAGNDVIDASGLFSNADPGILPTVGLTIYGGEGNDTIIGSQTGDHLAGGSGDDIIYGLRGVDHIYGDSGVNVNILTRALTIDTVDNSPEPTIDNSLQTNGTVIKPYPSPVRDDLTAGRDVIYGDGPGSVSGILGDFDDIIFGDHGEVIQNVADPNLPPDLLQKIQTTTLDSVLAINSVELQNGDDDVIFGNLDRDIIVGGAGNDMLDGDEADDLIFGDNVFLMRRDLQGINPDDGDLFDDITNPRFQTLIGGLLYSRSDRLLPDGVNYPNADDSGELLNDDIARNYRDPDGAPWWAEYLIDYSSQHNFDFDEGTAGVGSFGNDYIAGSEGHDEIFGQLGDDVIQGDGGIEDAFAADSHVGASRTSGGDTDPIGPLKVVSSFEASTDGEDYIEGGGGNDVIFGGLGQDDLIGGSSEFFSLIDPDMRPDGDDIIFGGAGTQTGRNNEELPDDDTVESERHARDADTIAGDNANIVRIVGVNGEDIMAEDPLAHYVSFNYDNYDPNMKIIVRGVELLDYTPGGPAFRPDLFSLTDSSDATFRNEFDIWAQVDIGGHDEVHGETGDDTVYTAGGQDRIFGDADDDDLIGGWGHDWISGGTGIDGILGDDGRIFTSRNSRSSNPEDPDYLKSDGESLYGVDPLLPSDPDSRTSQGNVLNEYIYTPGQVQTETINVSGELKKSVDLTPFNLTPNMQGGDDPLFDPVFADDIIFGGLGKDFLHGGSGDDAIGGGEALETSYTQLFDDEGAVVGIVRTDFNSPWNPGDILKFGEDTDPWNAPKPVRSRLGEFFLYDEYDPRRTILFNENGTVWKDGDAPDNQYFLNLVADEGPTVYGAVEFTKKGDPIAWADAHTDGDDVIFGDLGNDWLVGGTGRDHIYGGWGNDLMNGDDVLTTNEHLNDAPDTHIIYEDRVFGGTGLDVLIGNTGGDRLIDWVGEYNSYIVPFAPFGIATVSRQVPPHLFDFLWAQAAGDGVDTTRSTDVGVQTSSSRYSNVAHLQAEPYGELGLVTQKDHGLWQEQTGGPTDPQPGNIPGGARDIIRTADFNDGTTAFLAVDSGNWDVTQGVLTASAASLGEDAAAVFYLDDYLPIYYEIEAKVSTEKPTGGWKANAYVIFDYFSPTDFKYAGINISTNKIEMGYRDETGWHEVIQSNKPVKIKPGRLYDILVAVNGTNVTLTIDDKSWFSYNFQPRILDGEAVGLNTGMVGLGSQESRGTFDNFKIQILPPEITLDYDEDFNDGAADNFTGDQNGNWHVSKKRYDGIVGEGETGWSVINLGAALQAESYLDMEAKLSTTGIGGFIFDRYADNDFKFVAIDVNADQLIFGDVDPKGGWTLDNAMARTFDPGIDYTLKLVLKGASVSATVNGAMVGSWGYNSAVVDGEIGVLTSDGFSSFDAVRVRTNDPAFSDEGDSLMAATAPEELLGEAAYLTDDDLAPIVEEAIARWTDAIGIDDRLVALLHEVTFEIADFRDLTLGQATTDTIYIDADAAGYGWFVDETPWDDVEFTVADSDVGERMDLLTVVMHELGHVLGYDDLKEAKTPDALMSEALDAGERFAPVVESNTKHSSPGLISMDTSMDTDEPVAPGRAFLNAGQNDWLMDFLVNKAKQEYNLFEPKDDIKILIGNEDE